MIIAAAVVLAAGAGLAALVLTGVWPGPSEADRERSRALYAQAESQLAADPDAALAALDESIRLDAQNDALRMRASLYVSRGNYDGALRDLDKVIGRRGGLAVTYSLRCWLRGRGERLDGARADCDRAIKMNPELAAAFGNRGLVGLRQGRYAEAWADFNTALEKGGSDEWVAWRVFGRGLASWGREDVIEGREDIQLALRSNPGVAAEFADFGLGVDVMRELEAAAYADAMKTPSLVPLQHYLYIHPNGANAAEARAQVAAIYARILAEETAGRQTLPGFSFAQDRGPGAADSFGAIAISRSRWRVAFSTDYGHPQDAALAAARVCNSAGVRDCDAYAFRNVCAALAISPSDRIRGMAWAHAQDEAVDTAIAHCRSRGGRACVPVHSQCTPTPPTEAAAATP